MSSLNTDYIAFVKLCTLTKLSCLCSTGGTARAGMKD